MMLVEQTLFGEYDKVAIAIARIREFEPVEGYYVAFSGGKDSVVILDLVKRSGVKYDAHYNLTTVDPPELVNFIRRQHPEVEIIKPERTMWQIIRGEKTLPTRTRRFCCQRLKEHGGEGRKVVTGIRWQESNRRAKRAMVEACYSDKTKVFIHPIIDWSDGDIWTYIHGNNVPYCSLYDEGFKRLGCILCPMSRNAERDINRWPKYAEAYRRVCREIVNERLKNGEQISWKTGDEMFDWWCDRDAKDGRDESDQTVLFE